MEDTTKHFELEIVSPRGITFSGKVESVTCPGVEGRFQVLRNHAPFLSTLAVGHVAVVQEDGSTTHYSISGGVAQVFHNRMRLLADSAEKAESIDVERARQARQRAEDRLKAREQGLDAARAEAALARAINRIKVSQLV